MSYNLGFIGGGVMSTAISEGVIESGTHPASKVWVSGPHLQNLEHWKTKGANVTTRNGEVFCNCEVVFLGVKPAMLGKAIDDCINTMPQGDISHNILFVSMLAGVSIAKLKQALKGFKNLSIVRMLPNLPMTVGAGSCLYTPDCNVTEAQCQLLEPLMRSCGNCEKIDESLMDSLGSLIGCGPAYMFVVIEALADAAVKQGAPRDIAQRLAAQMVMGSGQLVMKTKKHPAVLKDQVCSPGGTTIAGVAALEDGKIRATFIRAIEASTLRSKEFGKM